MRRRKFSQLIGALPIGLFLVPQISCAKTYLSRDEAQRAIMGDLTLTPIAVELTRDQMHAIRKASKVRVRRPKLNAWKSADGHWFLVDQVIGKHENIDMAVGIDPTGGVMGIEILVYRETYGHQIRQPKWLAQFLGKDHRERLRLDHQIKNISGATLSCRHVTDGINRLTQTWVQVLQHI